MFVGSPLFILLVIVRTLWQKKNKKRLWWIIPAIIIILFHYGLGLLGNYCSQSLCEVSSFEVYGECTRKGESGFSGARWKCPDGYEGERDVSKIIDESGPYCGSLESFESEARSSCSGHCISKPLLCKLYSFIILKIS